MGKSNSYLTKDWIAATKNMVIFAYNPSELAVVGAGQDVGITKDGFESALRKASAPVKPAKSSSKTK